MFESFWLGTVLHSANPIVSVISFLFVTSSGSYLRSLFLVDRVEECVCVESFNSIVQSDKHVSQYGIHCKGVLTTSQLLTLREVGMRVCDCSSLISMKLYQ